MTNIVISCNLPGNDISQEKVLHNLSKAKENLKCSPIGYIIAISL